MKDSMLSVNQASDRLKETLIKYIEATYHISDENIIHQRNELLQTPNVIHNSPYIESTPRYQVDKSFSQLNISPQTKDLLELLSKRTGDNPARLFNPPYTHQAEALELTRSDAKKSLLVMTGTGSGKTETFLMPILSTLIDQAEKKYWNLNGIRALVLYPMNALVNDQVGRLRLILGDDRTRDAFIKANDNFTFLDNARQNLTTGNLTATGNITLQASVPSYWTGTYYLNGKIGRAHV